MTDTIAARYMRFAEVQAHGSSPLYEQLALGVSTDRVILDLLATLPLVKQQPNLLFAAARVVGGTPEGFAEFRTTVVDRWDDVSGVMRARLTQTNEPARCAALYPLLASLPQPLALVEVGASAGLCLYPDRYRYDYGYVTAGDQDSPLTVLCEVEGAIRPEPGPVDVVWRAGIDLNPLDVTNDDDVTWLETLIWPEHAERRSRLRAAVAIARTDVPHIVPGDLVKEFPGLIATAPKGATLVVFHSAVLNYVSADAREAFARRALTTGGHWLSQEGPGIVTRASAGLPTVPRGHFVLAHDGMPMAFTAPHGGHIRWLRPPS
jgi:Uncharacterized protein conserved in bacteria (DUF2332)